MAAVAQYTSAAPADFKRTAQVYKVAPVVKTSSTKRTVPLIFLEVFLNALLAFLYLSDLLRDFCEKKPVLFIGGVISLIFIFCDIDFASSCAWSKPFLAAFDFAVGT